MALADLPKYPNTVTIIPNTGVQFLDFGFNLLAPDGAKLPKVPRSWGFWDPKSSDKRPPTLLTRGDEEITKGKEDYTIDLKRVVQFVQRQWLPLPLFREEPALRYFPGPINWARAYLVDLETEGNGNNTYRLIIAIDTRLMDYRRDSAYLAPSPGDAQNGHTFSLPSSCGDYNFVLEQSWLREWLEESFTEMLKAEARKRQQRREVKLTEDQIADMMEGPNEPIARYIAFLDLLHQLDCLPKLKFADTITPSKQVYVDVDMVLDVGNSRTCGLLVEAEPDIASVDISRAFKLELRDLSRPEQAYSDPFDSRLEFALASFGLDHWSQRSGRADAFVWPTIVRVGPEAGRLAGSRRGSQGRTGMSSPKRYLWDEEQSQQSWRFNGQTLAGHDGIAAEGVFAAFVNDAGKPLHMLDQGDDDLPTLLARYSRSNLLSFALAEILLQAVAMINSPASRLRRQNEGLPRRLRRLILTMPTALSLTERRILEKRARAALELMYLCLGKAELRSGPNGDPALHWHDGYEPEIILKWDEASATQVVYLYSKIARGFSGDARAFIRSLRSTSSGNDESDSELCVATLDIGGGTTDLVITRLKVQGSGANVTIFPKQLFRESLTLAGDDIVQRLARDVVVGAVSETLSAKIGSARAEALVQTLFAGNRGDMSSEEQLRREQFALQVAYPVSIALLAEYERRYDPLDPPAIDHRPLRAFFSAVLPPQYLVTGIENDVHKATGERSFSLMDLPLAVDLRSVDLAIRGVVGDMLRNLAEVAWRYRSDVLLLSGRPSRFPAVKNEIIESGALPAHKVVAMNEFRVGPWYPYRDREARIADPKTTAAVGAMLCLLAEGSLQNFHFRSDELRPASVARYLGKMEQHNRLPEQDVYYRDLDLEDEDFELPAGQTFEFHGPIALGVRQFPNEWWPANQLYTIDYRDQEARRRRHGQTPLRIQLRRARVTRARGAGGQLTQDNDRLEIESIEWAGGSIPRDQLRMRLQTMPSRDGYWLDTGILLDR